MLDDDNLLVTVSGLHDRTDNKVHLWDALTGTMLTSPWTIDATVLDMIYDRSSRSVFILTEKSIWKWEINHFQPSHELATCMASALTGKYIDATGAIAFLSPKEHRTEAERLRQFAPDCLKLSKTDLKRWHQAKASWTQVSSVRLQYLNQLINLEPEQATHRIQRAAIYIESGENQLALKDLDWVIEKDPKLISQRETRGFLYFNMANVASHKKMETTGSLIDQGLNDLEMVLKQGSIGNNSLISVNEITWLICCNPKAPVDQCKRLLSLQEILCQRNNLWMFNNTLSLCYYRCKLFDKAHQSCIKCLEQNQNGGNTWQHACAVIGDYCNLHSLPLSHLIWPKADLSDLIILGLTQHQLGQKDACLATANRIKLAKLITPVNKNTGVPELLEEFETLLKKP